MKKIFCLMKYYLDPNEKTPFPKFDYQMSALKSLGYDVYYLGIKHGYIYLCNNDNEPIRKTVLNTIPALSTIALYDSIYRATEEVFKVKSDFDFAYIRSMPAMPSCVKTFQQIKKTDCRVILEIPTYPFDKETDQEKRILRRLFHKFSERYSLRTSDYVDLFALIGEKAIEYRGKPAINIENGISISNIPLRTPRLNNGEIHLLGLATMAYWHGYDRVIEGLRVYLEKGGQENIIFHLVGSDGDGSMQKWQVLTEKYGLDNRVIFEGFRQGNELSAIVNQCDVGIASLGLHRKNFSISSELKTREYMARGLPFVISTIDRGISPDLNFYLKIPADDSAVDMDKIIGFVKYSGRGESISERMREYAEENMTWETQFMKVFGWFDEQDNDKFWFNTNETGMK